jgi:hypothetical protein
MIVAPGVEVNDLSDPLCCWLGHVQLDIESRESCNSITHYGFLNIALGCVLQMPVIDSRDAVLPLWKLNISIKGVENEHCDASYSGYLANGIRSYVELP